MAHEESKSNGHLTVDDTWPQKIKSWPRTACQLFRTSPATCGCCSSSNLCSELCYKLPSVATFTFVQIIDKKIVPPLLNSVKIAAFAW